MILNRTLPVWSAENVSVENDASTHSHATVGSQASSLRGEDAGTGSGRAVDDKFDCLFEPVVGGFPRDDYVMHVAFTQARAADADEACLLLQLGNAARAAVSHPGTQAAHQLVCHLCQC